MKNKLVIIGGGGHCLSVIDSLDQSLFSEIVILDKNQKKDTFVNGIRVYGDDHELDRLYQLGFRYAFIALGSVGDTTVRRKLDKLVRNKKYSFINIIDQSAIVSSSVKLGTGIFIGKGAIVNAMSMIGNHCIINSGSIIEHECIIGDFSHIAPGATILGNCHIGRDTHIGANATLIQKVNVGECTIVGMGSTILTNVKENTMVYGIYNKKGTEEYEKRKKG